MIIKSKGRKDTDFDQLVRYINKEHSQKGAGFDFLYMHNIDGEKELDNIVRAFEQNDTYRKKRKNGVAHYHDIIAFSPEDTPVLQKNPHILQEIARKYIEQRCPDGLAIAKVHYDEAHWHIHVMYSGVVREGSEVQRVSKSDFEQIKRKLQSYQQEKYPELEHSYVKEEKERQNKGVRQAQSDAERRLEEREKKSDKHYVHDILQEALSLDMNGKRFKAFLKEHDIRVYSRGNMITGVVYRKRKYRFSTLFRGSPDTQKRVVGICLEEQRTSQRKRALEKNRAMFDGGRKKKGKDMRRP